MYKYFKCSYCGLQFGLHIAIITKEGMFCSQTHRVLSETESHGDNVSQHIADMERAAAERR